MTPSRPCAAPPELCTLRLRLRAPSLTDFDNSLAMWSHSAVSRHISPTPNNGEDVWGRLLRYIGHWYAMGFGYWVVEDVETGSYLGELGFADYHREIAPRIDGIPEMGWVFAAHAQGKGYATEAAFAALAWRDSELAPGPTVCLIAPENRSSLMLAAKLGFFEIARSHHRARETIVLRRDRDAAGPG